MTTAKATVFGRAWVFDDDHCQIEVWEHEFEPQDIGARSGAGWAHEHLCECYSNKDLRELFGLPPEGNFQVMFKGTITGGMSGYECQEWEEDFDLEEVKYQLVSPDYMKAFNERFA